MNKPLTREKQPRLGEIGLGNYAPYLMNRIMGRYNASLRAEMARQGLTTPKVRTLAVLAMIDGPLIGHLAVYAVVEFSTSAEISDIPGYGQNYAVIDSAYCGALETYLDGLGGLLVVGQALRCGDRQAAIGDQVQQW